MLTIPNGFCQFWQHFSCNFEKKNSFGSNCLREQTEKRKVRFASFDYLAGRFTVECTENGNMAFSYFDIYIYFFSNFSLDSKITDYLQCHIGLQLHTRFINFDLIKFREKHKKKNFSSNPCFEPNPRCSKLFALKQLDCKSTSQ